MVLIRFTAPPSLQQRGRGLTTQCVPQAWLNCRVHFGQWGDPVGPLRGFTASTAVVRIGGGVWSTARVQLSGWGQQISGSGVIPEIMSGTRGAAADKSLSEVEGRSQQQYGKYEFSSTLRFRVRIVPSPMGAFQTVCVCVHVHYPQTHRAPFSIVLSTFPH